MPKLACILICAIFLFAACSRGEAPVSNEISLEMQDGPVTGETAQLETDEEKQAEEILFGKKQIESALETYTIRHDNDGKTYEVVVICASDDDDRNNYKNTLQLFDAESNLLQSIDLGWLPARIEFMDVNLDGFTDIVTNTGGTVNETHDLYIWESSSQNFIKVIFEGFEMLAWFEVRDGYIDNFIRGSSPDYSVTEKLVWNGNILSKASDNRSTDAADNNSQIELATLDKYIL